MDRWQTFPVEFEGGLVTTLSPLQQGTRMPGSATTLRNFEPSTEGGYRRILGYEKWDSAQVTGSAALVRGVTYFDGYAIASVGDNLYRSGGSGWTQLTDNASFGSSGVDLGSTGKVRFAKHGFGANETLIIVDSTSKPFKFTGTAFSQITEATSETEGATHVVLFKNHLFYASGKTVTFSAPFTDDDFTPASGAGTLSFNNTITDMIVFREQLVIFTEDTISILVGTSIADFQLKPVANDVGCTHSDTVQEIGGDVMFLSADGLRLLSATERNNDFGLGVVSKIIQSEIVDFVDKSDSFASLTIRGKSQYRLLGYQSTYSKDSSRGIIGTQFAQQGGAGMAWAETRGIQAYVAHAEYSEAEEFILFAANDGYVYRMERGNSFDGSNIRATFNTPYLPIGDPTTRKTLYKAKLYLDPQGSVTTSMSVNFDFDEDGVAQPDSIDISNTATQVAFYGVSTYGSGEYGGTIKYVFDTQLEGSGSVASFRFESESDDPPFSFDSLVIQYGQYGRR